MTTRRRRPTFLFIGPDKTGSTWMYEILRRHPGAWVPPIKDLYFFDRYYDRGIDWYLSFFDDAPRSAMAVGEFSHDYLFSRQAAERIRSHLPGVKILTCLRDPAERTFSHYLYLVRSGLTRAPFGEALATFPELLVNSRYYEHLVHYFRRFDREQMGILWFETLESDAEGFGRDLLGQIGLPFLPDLPYESRFLAASRPRSAVLARILKWGAGLFRRFGMPEMVGRVKRSNAALKLYAPFGSADRPRLTVEQRAQVVRALRDDIEALEDFLQVDLSHWKATEPPTKRH